MIVEGTPRGCCEIKQSACTGKEIPLFLPCRYFTRSITSQEREIYIFIVLNVITPIGVKRRPLSDRVKQSHACQYKPQISSVGIQETKTRFPGPLR